MPQTGITPVNHAPVAVQKDLDLGRIGMATGQYESFGFTEAKGSVPAGVVIGGAGSERKINALSFPGPFNLYWRPSKFLYWKASRFKNQR